MLGAAAEAAGAEIRLLAVTLLTHLDGESLRVLGLPGDGSERAVRWARMARAAGCAGAVCSPGEVAALRSALAHPFLLVTPGIRPTALPGADDQRRVAAPEDAFAAGSDLLVIGRPLTRAADPERALTELAGRLVASTVG